MNQRKTLAWEFLNTILKSIKKDGKIEGFAFIWLEEVIEISYLNGFYELMNEALELRNSTDKFGNPLAGAITNFELIQVNAIYNWPKEKIELEQKYTYDRVVDFLKICRNSNESSLFINSPKEIKSALERAKDDFDLEIISCSLAVGGYFDSALNIINNYLSEFPYRIRISKIVICIELFRKGDFDEAKSILEEVYPERNSSWDNLFFARGILGYEPWGGYPFSDY
ncbi:MAG: hypothetical protein AAF741_12390 [Bacteroidota bacterium]